MRRAFEIWSSDSGSATILAYPEEVADLKKNGLMEADAECLQSFLADTLEEASAIYYLRMGWEPYKPMGKAQLCPNQCGSLFYPEGSGECPKCGKVV